MMHGCGGCIDRHVGHLRAALLGAVAVLLIAACGGDVVDSPSDAAGGTCATVCAAGPYTCTDGSSPTATLTIEVATATGCTAVLSTTGQPDRDVIFTCSTNRACILAPASPCGLPCMGPVECDDVVITEPDLTFTLGALTCH
jgi:hypothetical protein